MDRLKNRSEFLRAQRGIRRVTPGLTLEICANPGGQAVRVGFTASRKVGNAVLRNRCKRRLRAAAAAVLPLCGRPGTDYVLVARQGTATRPFEKLTADLGEALRAAHLKLGRPGDAP
ncbi:MAG: ribonuclease P protein component [Rhizomicrobium sp.]